MTSENIQEITKSLAYGMTASEVAEIEGVDVSEIERIERTYSEEIAEKAKYLDGRE